MKRFHVLLSVLIPLIFIVFLYSINFEFISILELKLTDLVQRSSPQRENTVPIVIVAVDDKSIEEVGRWPWPRDDMAKLIRNISKSSPKVIGVDIIFSEGTKTMADSLKEEIKRSFHSFFGIEKENIDSFFNLFLRGSEKVHPEDDALGEAVGRAGNVILGYHFITSEGDITKIEGKAEKGTPILPRPFGVVKGKTEYLKKITAYDVLEDIPAVSKNALSGGFFNVIMDADGTVRRIPAAFYYNGDFYPSLSLELARSYLDLPYSALFVSDYGIDGVKLGKSFVPTDDNGFIRLKYLGPERTFPYVSASDVIKGKADMSIFKDAVVLIGVSAVGLGDVKVTPMGNIYPGVEIHATAVENIVTGNVFFAPGWIKVTDIFLIIVLGVAFGIFLSRIGPFLGMTTTAAAVFGYIFLFRYLFLEKNVAITMIYPAATLLTMYISVTTTKYFAETKRKRFIQRAFSHYLSPFVIEQLIKNPEKLTLGGEKKELTVMFTDLAGFSMVSERFTPEDVVGLLNEFFTSMTDIILAHNGTVDKFEGDAIMAFFGAPVGTPDHALQAVRAAYEMQLKLKELWAKWREEDKPAMLMRIGINTGPMVVGNMGSVHKMNYTVMGDSVNVAARLETAGKIYGSEILIGGETKRAVEGEFTVRELDLARVHGRETAVKIYEVMGKSDEMDETGLKALRLFKEARELYVKRDFEGAKRVFEEIIEIDPDDRPSRLYIERCGRFIVTPPDDSWEGISELTVK
ncbi:MAG: adenylate/guanylate cyclase domain-containing protein [Deltaproteobacteria bacterium]|uniref:Adenylate/guanylate cyclase domain-containing protein n=1 Tax=Candidatus Zymogenus saltonus TaxID=2844893 RepID=A0A9D8PQ87_9DELT|nr:adenylate/guanylate cyclase domain-containing protein [Candidatus Zymogenus saltonus]